MSRLNEIASHWPQINLLLDEVLDIAEPERDAWVDSLAGERAAFRDTLRSLLGGLRGPETHALLNTLPRLAISSSQHAREAVAGRLVGPYRLISELGRGGMGSVWLAEHADGTLSRRVAVKLPHIAWTSALAERLVREREILSSLSHPGIARVFDAGLDGHARPYFAMEYVEGWAIDRYCREQALPLRARIGLLLQVCDAVAHAHAHLVVHRDLKPGNVLVTTDGITKLLDFGIAKLMDGDRTEETALTRQAGLGMTLDYASPEQIAGQPLGTASDIYSLGVVAFELLAGQRPYQLERGSRAELEEAIAEVAPRLASDVAVLPEDKRALRGDLNAILGKALSKAPDKRYPTVAALADDLKRHIAGLPVFAQPDSRLYIARKFVARHRIGVASATVVVLAVTVGFGVALWQYRAAAVNLAFAEQAFNRENAARVLFVETLSTIASWDAAAFAEPRSVSRILLRKMEEMIKRFDNQPEPQLGVLRAVSQQLPYIGEHEASLQIGNRYIELLDRTAAHPSHRILAELQRARTLSTLGRHEEGVAAMRQAVETIPNQREAPHERVRMQVEFAKMLAKTGRRDEAHAVLNAAEKAAEGKAGFVEARADVHLMQARLRFGFDDPAALRHMQLSHAGFTTLPAATVPQVGFSYWHLGLALLGMGRPVDAEAALREGGRRFDEVYGPVDRDSVSVAGALALALASQGRYEEARALLVERQSVVDIKPGPDTTAARRALAARRLQLELLTGDIGAARPFAIAPETVDPNDPHALIQATGTAELQRAVGQGEEAAERLGKLLEAMPVVFRSGAVGFELRLALAASLASNEAALAAYQQLLADMRAARATETWLYEQAVESCAATFARQGRWEDGSALLQALDARPAGPRVAAPSRIAIAESAWRRAIVRHAAGDRLEAAALMSAAQDQLAGQHPQSPWRANGAALSTAMAR